jgi:hypothetical protein
MDVSRRAWRDALAASLLALAVYSATAWQVYTLRRPKEAYFDLLADAFLHGRLHLEAPRATHDLTLHEGRWYVPFPPLPALLLVPAVAALGLERVNPIALSLACAAASTGLALLLLDALRARGLVSLARAGTVWLTLLFALGTPHWSIAPLGEVWYTAQVATVTFTLLAALLAARQAPPGASGAALGAAMLARPHVLLLLPLLAGLHAAHGPLRRAPWVRLATGPAAALALLVAYNLARFGSPFDFGYAHQAVAPELQADLARHGQFSLHYVARNLRTALFGLPMIEDGRWAPDPFGLSLFLVTPAFLLWLRTGAQGAWRRGAWAALGLGALPLVTYYNTGWFQFGWRFVLDLAAPALVLLAAGAGTGSGRLVRALVLASVAVNAWGVAWWGATWYPRVEPRQERKLQRPPARKRGDARSLAPCRRIGRGQGCSSVCQAMSLSAPPAVRTAVTISGVPAEVSGPLRATASIAPPSTSPTRRSRPSSPTRQTSVNRSPPPSRTDVSTWRPRTLAASALTAPAPCSSASDRLPSASTRQLCTRSDPPALRAAVTITSLATRKPSVGRALTTSLICGPVSVSTRVTCAASPLTLQVASSSWPAALRAAVTTPPNLEPVTTAG